MSSVNTEIFDKTVKRRKEIREFEEKVAAKAIEKLNSRESINDDPGVESYLKQTFIEFCRDQLTHTYNSIKDSVGSFLKVKKPPPIAEDLVLKRPVYSERTIEKTWKHIALGERKRYEALIRKGIAEGKTTEQIVATLPKDRLVRNQLRTLVVTATTSIYNQADHEVYAANKGIMKGWQYVAILDSRTTSICRIKDGNIYPIGDYKNMPPSHFGCRSITVPVVRSYDDLQKNENLQYIRKRNLPAKEASRYDGMANPKETYADWLARNPTNATISNLSFELAKAKLDKIRLPIYHKNILLNDKDIQLQLKEYYQLQAKDLQGKLSLTNFRGITLGTKNKNKLRVRDEPPNIYNPVTKQWEHSQIYRPDYTVRDEMRKLLYESLDKNDADFIDNFVEGLALSTNEKSVVSENLRNIFQTKGTIVNFKALSNGRMNYDVMNVSARLEQKLRGKDVFSKLRKDLFQDSIVGEVDFNDVTKNFLNNIKKHNIFEDTVIPAMAWWVRPSLRRNFPPAVWARVNNRRAQQAIQESLIMLGREGALDLDYMSLSLGRRLYEAASLNGSKNEWRNLGEKIIRSSPSIMRIEEFTTQKRRLRSKMSGEPFGGTYDTTSYHVIINNKPLSSYHTLHRKIRIAQRLTNDLRIRPGQNTYFIGAYNTRIPLLPPDTINSFPLDVIDSDLANALNWYSKSSFKVDKDFFRFVDKMIKFQDDRGNAQYYNDKNTFKQYLASRDDTYERFKAMEWYDKNDLEIRNAAFIDHRGRIYDRGFISPQSGETYRPFLISTKKKQFNETAYELYRDQVGSFLGGLDDAFEGRFDSLTVKGRLGVEEHWRPAMIKIGEAMLRGKPNDIRYVIDSDIVQAIDGEDLSKFLRFCLESARLNNHLKSGGRINNYMTDLVLEQDASSSGAQIIALTTKNKRLAELSNVVPTPRKQRLYDEIAHKTFIDPRFIELNTKFHLTEKDLRKAAKAQNMVTFYGAGKRTAAINVENKLGKILGKQDNTLVLTTTDKQLVLNEISARAARFKKFDPDMYDHLMDLRKVVRDSVDSGREIVDEIMEEMWFLTPESKDFLIKLGNTYDLTVTPKDFKAIAEIMSEHLSEQAPILNSFTRFLGRLAEDYLNNVKPRSADFDWSKVLTTQVIGNFSKGYQVPKLITNIAGAPKNSKEFMAYLGFADPRDTIFGFQRGRIERKNLFRFSLSIPYFDFKKKALATDITPINVTLFKKGKNVKASTTAIPWVNFDGKIMEQDFSMSFDEVVRRPDGTRNILSIGQKSKAGIWDELKNDWEPSKVSDTGGARTAFGVNGNHSNDATLVKNFMLWGRKNNIDTTTIHDAFFTNIVDMDAARTMLRSQYAKVLNANSIGKTLLEMKKRGLPVDIYKKYLKEAIDLGLIPIPGKSKINGETLKKGDVLTSEEILKELTKNVSWYGIG